MASDGNGIRHHGLSYKIVGRIEADVCNSTEGKTRMT